MGECSYFFSCLFFVILSTSHTHTHTHLPWIRRTLDVFLSIFFPCPQVRWNYFSTRPAVCSSWCWNTNYLLGLTLPEITIQKLILEFCLHFPNLRLKIETFNDNDDEEATNKDNLFFLSNYICTRIRFPFWGSNEYLSLSYED